MNNKIRESVRRKEIERGLNLKLGIREKPIPTITQGGGEMQNSCRSEIEMRGRNRKDIRRGILSLLWGTQAYHFDIWTHTVNFVWQYNQQTTSQIQFGIPFPFSLNFENKLIITLTKGFNPSVFIDDLHSGPKQIPIFTLYLFTLFKPTGYVIQQQV